VIEHHAAVAPPGRWQRVFKLMQPSGRAMRYVYILLGIIILLAAGILLMVVIADQQSPACRSQPGECFRSLMFGFTVLALPVTLVLLAVAALSEKRSAPRALLCLTASGVAGLAGLVVAGVFATQEGAVTDMVGFFCLAGVAPLTLLFSIPGIYSGTQAAPELRAVLQEDLAGRALFLIQARGEISLDDLAAERGMAAQDCHVLVEQLRYCGQLPGTLDTPRGRVYSAAGLADRQHRLLEAVQRAGQISLDGLVAALGGPEAAPETVVVDWIYQLVQRGQFSGYINWPERTLYAAQAGRIGANSQCPCCGGKLGIQPVSTTLLYSPPLTIRCQHCGSELLK